jgi:hypothetical protein
MPGPDSALTADNRKLPDGMSRNNYYARLVDSRNPRIDPFGAGNSPAFPAAACSRPRTEGATQHRPRGHAPRDFPEILEMPMLRLFPVWQPHPRFIEVDVEVGETLRTAVARVLGIFGQDLHSVDRGGTEQPLDREVSVDVSLPDLAVSLRPLRFPLGLFESTAGIPRAETAHLAGLADPLKKDPTDWPLMTDGERALAASLGSLGLVLDSDSFDFERVVAGFPDLEGGWDLTRPSPYRILFAAARLIADPELTLDLFEDSVERAASLLWRKLRLSQPDALDLRLELFCEWNPAGVNALRRRVGGNKRPAFPGRCHLGWRRVGVHFFRDVIDRLGQMANLGRQLAVEKADAALRQRLQEACSTFVSLESERSWLDFQVQVTIRPVEERLRAQAETLLLARLLRVLTDTSSASSGLSWDWAQGTLRRCGFFERQFERETEGLRLGESAQRLATSVFRRFEEEQFGAAIDELDTRRDLELRRWLHELRRGADPVFLSPAELATVNRTVWVEVACRLRFEIETLVEQRTFPPYGKAELSFAQFLDILNVLMGEGANLADQTRGSSGLRTWLMERCIQLDALLPTLRETLLNSAEGLFTLTSRFAARLGWTTSDRYRIIAEAFSALRHTWLERHLLTCFLNRGKEAAMTFAFVEKIASRLEALREALIDLQGELTREIAERERMADLGALGISGPLPASLENRLKQGVELLDLDEAFRRVFRREGQLLDLAQLRPDTLLAELLNCLERPLFSLISELAMDGELPRVAQLLPAAVNQLFVESLLPHSGRQGRPGAFDTRTHLLLLTSPTLASQYDTHELILIVRQRLEAVGVSPELPISVLVSRAAPGLILVRCVHALAAEEVLG